MDAVPPVFAIEHELTPAGDVAVARGTAVEATGGEVGRVDDFVIDPVTERVTHLVLRTGHLWGTRDVTIPVEAIERIDELTVRLKLNKHAIGALPAVPARLR
jgi:sporulation protein YlmC with PRC-barrel domain